MLTEAEVRLILELIREEHGPGYSGVPEVGRLQAKLSIMLEMATHAKTAKQFVDMKAFADATELKLEKLRVSLARAAQLAGLPIPGVDDHEAPFEVLCRAAREHQDGWNKLVIKILERLEEVESLRAYVRALEDDNAKLLEALSSRKKP